MRPVVLTLTLLAALTLPRAPVWCAPADGGPAPPAAVELRLSLADAIRRGQEHSATVRAACARVAEAGANVKAAGANPPPMLALAHGAGANTGGLDEDVVLSETFEMGGKRTAREQAACHERDAVQVDQCGSVNDLVFSVQSAYYAALKADVERQVALEALKSAEAFGEAAQVRFDAGNVPQSQVVRSRVEVSSAQQELDAADTEQVNRYSELQSLLGVPPATHLALTDTLQVVAKPYKLDELVCYGLAHRPDVTAAQVRRLAQAANVRVAQVQSRPDLFVEARHDNLLDPLGGGSSLRVGVIFPVGGSAKQRGEVQAAQAVAAEQAATGEETGRVAQLEITTAYNDLLKAQREVQAYQQGRLDEAKQLLAMAQLGYDKGANSYLELLDAQHEYSKAQADYARAQAAYHVALITLQHAVGGQLP